MSHFEKLFPKALPVILLALLIICGQVVVAYRVMKTMIDRDAIARVPELQATAARLRPEVLQLQKKHAVLSEQIADYTSKKLEMEALDNATKRTTAEMKAAEERSMRATEAAVAAEAQVSKLAAESVKIETWKKKTEETLSALQKEVERRQQAKSELAALEQELKEKRELRSAIETHGGEIKKDLEGFADRLKTSLDGAEAQLTAQVKESASHLKEASALVSRQATPIAEAFSMLSQQIESGEKAVSQHTKDLSDKLGQADAQITKLQVQLGDIRSKATDAIAEVQAVATASSSLRTSAEKSLVEFQGVKTQLSDAMQIQSDRNETGRQLGTEAAQTLKAVSELETAITSLKISLDGIRNNASDVAKAVTGATSKLDAVGQRLDDVGKQAATLETTLKAQSEAIMAVPTKSSKQ